MVHAPSLHIFARLLAAAACLGSSMAAQLPSVSAGPDRLIIPPQTSLRLIGQYSFQSSGPFFAEAGGATVIWSQLSGPPATILDGNTIRPTVVPGHAGSIELQLRVNDPRFGTFVDNVLVHVLGTDQDAAISGEPRKWQKLELTFQHDAVLSETGPVNPFLDLRLTAYFVQVQTGTLRVVPGFFAADGNAAETGAASGSAWRVNFTPDQVGDWYYLVSFRGGPGVALDPLDNTGQPVSFHNANGVFHVAPPDPAAPGFLAKGQLQYVGGHFLRFAETHEYFLKNGAGSPENFFGYYEFDGTSDLGGDLNDLNTAGAFDGLHHYDPHLGDYVDLGVPLWQNGKGRRIFGALSYLASRGVNSLYALSYNIDGGDGREVWPWTEPLDKLHFDVSKLAQWERVLDHMQRAGIVWHVMTQENENDHVLDGGVLGLERKLYYRELVARFGHALGLVWNLGEENANTPEERRSFADYIRLLDPQHPIALHNIVGDLAGTFGTLLGTHLEMVSIQGDPQMTPARALQLVLDSQEAGRPWVVNFDEQTPASDGVVPDAFDFWHDYIRREALWPMLLNQGGGLEWYFGYAYPDSDVDCENFRGRENLWLLAKRALAFLQSSVPQNEVVSANELATGNDPSVLAKLGVFYLVYLPFGGPVTLDLQGHAGPFLVSWFNARDGGNLANGTVTQVSGPGPVSIGAPPGQGDWVAFVRSPVNLPPVIESVSVLPGAFSGGQDFLLSVHASDPNGPSDPVNVTAQFISPGGGAFVTVPLTRVGGTLYSLFSRNAPGIEAGAWQVVVKARDSNGASVTQTTQFTAL